MDVQPDVSYIPCATSSKGGKLTISGQNNTRKCDTKRFVPVTTLNGVVGLLSSFIRSLIVSTGKIWSIVYIYVKWIYASKTLAFTISECEIVRHVTLTCPFISWCSVDANIKWTPKVWHTSWNSVRVNYVPASYEILSKCQHPNSSIFPKLDFNIPILSITSSVAIIPIP